MVRGFAAQYLFDTSQRLARTMLVFNERKPYMIITILTETYTG